MPTKAELQAELDRLKAQQKKWGDAAIEFADRKGYCSEVEEFLEAEGIPYTKNNIRVTFLVEVTVEAQCRKRDPEIINDRFLIDSLQADEIESSLENRADYVLDEDFEVDRVEVGSVDVKEWNRVD